MSDFQSDAVPILETSSMNYAPYRFFYRGPSMAPTFRPGQVLYINPQGRGIAAGDVIVFHHQEGKDHVVHRVIKLTEDGYLTRGDNNLRNDPAPILPGQIVGRVEMAKLGDQIEEVKNGRRGLWQAKYLRKRLLVKRLLRRVLGKPYYWLKCSGIVAKLWRPELEAIRFETPDGPLVKYIHKGRTVASGWTDTNRWWFRRPYDFVIRPKPNK